MGPAYDFIKKNGLASEISYPYNGLNLKHGVCNRSKSAGAASAKISGYIATTGEENLLEAVARQPVSVGIKGSGQDFQLYYGGIFDYDLDMRGDGCRGVHGRDDLDHAVAVVGYGTDENSNTKYWLIKNSWGEAWGEAGFMKIKRNPDGPYGSLGMCGLAIDVSYPIL
ncbi:unnamed protein product [Cuscuta epithymum]|uniref:Peptidase C1A papain C-terminal domain-containing protein n=1 Tax=Cuscuta epithymum TaxID=186058 RepID=A0AAV0F4X7_9ASTE|nr:unnamed protein product [Cuscuta epithymum]